MRKDILLKLSYLILPAIVFYICYKYIGILVAILLSASLSVAAIIYNFAKHKTVPHTQILGVLGLLLSFVAVLFTDNEKLYYVPALCSNCLLACFALLLTLRHKSIFHYIVKDFNIPIVQNVPEDQFIPLNIMWLAFFIIKAVSKVLGILFMSFESLYWLVFLLGDPMTIVLVVCSAYFVNKKASLAKKERNNTTA